MRACGCFLLLINLAFSTMMLIVLRENYLMKRHEIVVIALATYTFYTLSMTIVNCWRSLKRNDYVYSCARLISLTAASVSIVTLTNTMLSTFGEGNMVLRNIILPILSGVVALFIIVCAALMIYKANMDLRIIKNEKE